MLSIDANALVIFLIVWGLVFLLTKLFFNPVRKIVNERDNQVKNNKKAGQSASDSFEQGLLEVEAKLKSARADAETRRSQIEAEAQGEKTRMIAELQGEYKAQVSSARSEMSAKIEELKKELESQVETLAERIEQKILP